MVVSLGVVLANLIDVDHLPGIFMEKKFEAFDCLLNPYCGPAYVGTPLHNWWTVLVMIGITFLSFKFVKNPLLTFFCMGIVLGLTVHLLMDRFYPGFYDWYNQADSFKTTIFGLN